MHRVPVRHKERTPARARAQHFFPSFSVSLCLCASVVNPPQSFGSSLRDAELMQ